MVYKASGRYWFHIRAQEPRSWPLRCVTAEISTVVKGSRWGAWVFNRYADHHEQQCKPGNGITIEHKVGERWYVYWEASDAYPPTHDRRSSRGVIKGVPRAVAKDLYAGLGYGWVSL